MKPTVGRNVHYYPKQTCITPDSMEKYASTITQVNKDGTVELVTFGPNSVYFQHAIKFSEKPENGCWTWPVKEEELHQKFDTAHDTALGTV